MFRDSQSADLFSLEGIYSTVSVIPLDSRYSQILFVISISVTFFIPPFLGCNAGLSYCPLAGEWISLFSPW